MISRESVSNGNINGGCVVGTRTATWACVLRSGGEEEEEWTTGQMGIMKIVK